MRDVYSKYYVTAREKIFGFLAYDRNLCNYICATVPRGSMLLDVAVGTGYPFADFLQKAGYVVHGIDISPLLIEECRQLNPEIRCVVGDVEEMDYQDSYFDCTYCFHSTFYFPNVPKAVDEMLRVTRPGGLVLFDIQNGNNEGIEKGYRRMLSEHSLVRRILRYGKNLAKIVLLRGPLAHEWEYARGFSDWRFVVHETPTYPEAIYQQLQGRPIAGFQVMVRKDDDSIEARSGLGPLSEYDRLIFVVRK